MISQNFQIRKAEGTEMIDDTVDLGHLDRPPPLRITDTRTCFQIEKSKDEKK